MLGLKKSTATIQFNSTYLFVPWFSFPGWFVMLNFFHKAICYFHVLFGVRSTWKGKRQLCICIYTYVYVYTLKSWKPVKHWFKIKQSKKEEDIPCSWIKRINIVKTFIFLKTIYKVNAISIKISTSFSQTRRNF